MVILLLYFGNFGPISLLKEQQILSKVPSLVVKTATAVTGLNLKRWHLSIALIWVIVCCDDAGVHLVYLVLIYHESVRFGSKMQLFFVFESLF